MADKQKVVEFSIDRIANSTVKVDIEALREARNTDNRGYATWALKTPNGNDFCIASNDQDLLVQMLVIDNSKKSKGKDKAGKESF
jgi:hypothetical protein|tara:strand:+ start:388 stop:642 length:255 start_codon:yes stop_codon:yes gene_type:complete